MPLSSTRQPSSLKQVREVVDGTSVEKGNVRGTAKHTHVERGHTSSSMLSMSFKLFFSNQFVDGLCHLSPVELLI